MNVWEIITLVSCAIIILALIDLIHTLYKLKRFKAGRMI